MSSAAKKSVPSPAVSVEENMELVRDLVLGWFAAESSRPLSVRQYLIGLGERRSMIPAVEYVVERAQLARLRRKRDDRDAQQMAVARVEEILLGVRNSERPPVPASEKRGASRDGKQCARSRKQAQKRKAARRKKLALKKSQEKKSEEKTNEPSPTAPPGAARRKRRAARKNMKKKNEERDVKLLTFGVCQMDIE